MVEAAVTKVVGIIGAIPFTGATWIVLAMLAFFMWLFSKANHDPKSRISWEDLIVDSATERASPYKLGFLVGVIVSTWIAISFADSNRLTFDILGVYLTFLVGGVGVNVLAKRAVAKIADSNPVEPDNKK